MPTDTSVKFIHSAMTGAPALTGQAGSLIALLDACLVNGFGTGGVDSIVIAGGVATVTRSAGHPFEAGSVALIAGATVSGGSINGEQKVLASPAPTTTTYCFDATGIANQTATGSITHKVAPLGWAKVYSGTNLAVYKSNDVAATGCMLRVDDTGTTSARAIGYLEMTSVDVGTGPFPTTGQLNGGIFWPKSSVADASARGWTLCGDGRAFYASHAWSTGSSNYATPVFFGDPLPTKSPDPYSGSLIGPSVSAVSGTSGTTSVDLAYAGAALTPTMGRSYSGLGSAAPVSVRPAILWGAVGNAFSGAAGHPFPNPADGGLYCAPVFLTEGSGLVIRAQLPGLYFVPQNIGSGVFATRDTVAGTAGLAGKTLKAIAGAASVVFLDMTGPWR